MEYSLSHGLANINQLAKFIATVITGKDNDRDERKRIRSKIVYAISKGELEGLNDDKYVEVGAFFRWAFNLWPQLKGIKGLPSQHFVVEANASTYTLTGFPTDTYILPGDVDELKELYRELRKENKSLKCKIEEKDKTIKAIEAELDAYRLKEKQQSLEFNSVRIIPKPCPITAH